MKEIYKAKSSKHFKCMFKKSQTENAARIVT